MFFVVYSLSLCVYVMVPQDEHKLLLVGSSLLGTGLDSDLDLVCVMRHPKPDQVLIKILTQQEAELGEASPWVLANRAQLKRGGGPKNSRSTVKLRHRPSGIEADIMFFCLDSRGAGVKMSEVGPLDLLHMLNKQSIRPRANPNNSVAHVAGQAPVILKVAEEYGLLTELRTLMKFIRVLFRGAGLRPHQNGYICNGGSDAIGLDVLIKLKQKYEDALARGEKPPLVTVLDAYIGFLTVLTNDLDKYHPHHSPPKKTPPHSVLAHEQLLSLFFNKRTNNLKHICQHKIKSSFCFVMLILICWCIGTRCVYTVRVWRPAYRPLWCSSRKAGISSSISTLKHAAYSPNLVYIDITIYTYPSDVTIERERGRERLCVCVCVLSELYHVYNITLDR